jgi:Flp pilus assembly protein TadD
MLSLLTRPEATVRHAAALLVLALVSITAGGCAQLGDVMPAGLSAVAPTDTVAADVAAVANPQMELRKATEYWGKEHAKSPRDPEIALKYARNLKALGAKPQALAVLQQAYQHNNTHIELLSEYGRLALELDQTQLALTLLAAADNPAKPDWRVLSARGAALAKQGKQREAIPFLERAIALAPDQPSVINNLALAYALDGQPAKAEEMLRRALASSDNAKVRQNLVIVLSLQGKFDDARGVAGEGAAPVAVASADLDYLRTMARAEPRASSPMPAAPPPTAVARTAPRAPTPPPSTAPMAPPSDPVSPVAPAVAGWSTTTATGR